MTNVCTYNDIKYVFVDELVDKYNESLEKLVRCPSWLGTTNVGQLASCVKNGIEVVDVGDGLRIAVAEDAVVAYMNSLISRIGKNNNSLYYGTRSALLARAITSLDPFVVVPFKDASLSSSARFSDTLAFSEPVIPSSGKKKSKKQQQKQVMNKSPQEMVDYFSSRILRRVELNRKDMQKLLEYKAVVDKKIDTLNIAMKQMQAAVAA